jgi:hypothetical protein
MRAGGRSWETKVDHRLRALLARTEGHPVEASQLISVFVRFLGDAGTLRAYGLAVRAIASDIATASIILSDVPRAASAPEVVFIELSQPLGLDATARAGADTAMRDAEADAI